MPDVGVVIQIIITESMHTAVCSNLEKLALQMIVVKSTSCIALS